MHPEHPDQEAKILWMRQPGIINFSILPPHQSQEAPAMQRAALPHTAVLDTSGSCLAVLIIPLATSRTAAPHTPVSTFYPRQPGRNIIDFINNKAQVTVPFPGPFPHINRQDMQVSSQLPPVPTRQKASIARYRASVWIILILFHWGPCILNIRTRKRRSCGYGSLE